MKRKPHSQGKRQPVPAPTSANVYLRPKRIPPEKFLHLVSGRDKPEFKQIFADWLHNGCHVRLVRDCFDTEPDRHRDEFKKRLLPKRFQSLMRRATAEKDETKRRRLLGAADRILTPARTDKINSQLKQKDEQFRSVYVGELVEALARLSPLKQVHYLNRHLRGLKVRHLLAPQCELPPRGPRKMGSGVPKGSRHCLTTKMPRSISLDEVQDDYYQQHPEWVQHKQNQKKLIFDRQLGGKLAAQMARPHIDGERLWLEEFAQELASSNQLRDLLEAQFQHRPNQLRQFVTELLKLHLDHLAHPAEAEVLRAWFKAAIRRCGSNKSETTGNLWRIHRAARKNPDLVTALCNFFFHGLPPNELRLRPGLAVKLLPTLKYQDIPLLIRFLFQNKPQQTLGLVPQWVKDKENGSPLRKSMALVQAWPDMVKAFRAGKKDAELMERADKAAEVVTGGKSKDVETAARRRQRLGLKYPRE